MIDNNTYPPSPEAIYAENILGINNKQRYRQQQKNRHHAQNNNYGNEQSKREHYRDNNPRFQNYQSRKNQSLRYPQNSIDSTMTKSTNR
jgi:hypothetical protein